MVGQNLHGRQSEARAEHDLEINVKAERKIEAILLHLEHQNKLRFFRKKVEPRIKGRNRSSRDGIRKQSIEFLPYLV